MTSEDKPVPRRASMRISLEASRGRTCSADRNRRILAFPAAFANRRYMAAASRLRSATGVRSSTRTLARWRCSRRATTNPSPPLFPLPQRMVTVLPRIGPYCVSSWLTIPSPARSIKVALGIFASVIVRRSSSCISAPVTMFIGGLVWEIERSVAYVAMSWQGRVTLSLEETVTPARFSFP